MYIKAKNMELPEENFVSMLSALGSVKDAIISGEHLDLDLDLYLALDLAFDLDLDIDLDLDPHIHFHIYLHPNCSDCFRGESGGEQGGAGELLGGHQD